MKQVVDGDLEPIWYDGFDKGKTAGRAEMKKEIMEIVKKAKSGHPYCWSDGISHILSEIEECK